MEDCRTNLVVYVDALLRRGYDVRGAASIEQARAALASQVPDIILLDILLPRVTGFEFLDELRAMRAIASVPIILISSLSDQEHLVEGLCRGANDYVPKPIVIPVLVARMEALLRTSALVRKLALQTEMLAKLAAFDELTGLYNRRSLLSAIETEISRSRRYGHVLSLLMLDVDHFKSVNDRWGHPVGDAVLRAVADRARSCLRTTDALCRYGGEEFCALLPETGSSGAVTAAERVRRAVGGAVVPVGSATIRVTISVGVASYTPATPDVVPDLIAAADRALLEAKRQGRDRVVVAT